MKGASRSEGKGWGPVWKTGRGASGQGNYTAEGILIKQKQNKHIKSPKRKCTSPAVPGPGPR